MPRSQPDVRIIGGKRRRLWVFARVAGGRRLWGFEHQRVLGRRIADTERRVYSDDVAQRQLDELLMVMPELGAFDQAFSEARAGDCGRCGAPSATLTVHRSPEQRYWFCSFCRTNSFIEALQRDVPRSAAEWRVREHFESGLLGVLPDDLAEWRASRR